MFESGNCGDIGDVLALMNDVMICTKNASKRNRKIIMIFSTASVF